MKYRLANVPASREIGAVFPGDDGWERCRSSLGTNRSGQGTALLEPFAKPFSTISKLRGLNRQLEELLGFVTVIFSMLTFSTRLVNLIRK